MSERPLSVAVLFGEERPPLTDPLTVLRVLAYLRDGEPLTAADDRTDDVLDPARVGAVPGGYRTDGAWIWPDAVGYYLAEHGVTPDPGLLAHMYADGYRCARPDGVAMHRAADALERVTG